MKQICHRLAVYELGREGEKERQKNKGREREGGGKKPGRRKYTLLVSL
jgi:hypothetical protein